MRINRDFWGGFFLCLGVAALVFLLWPRRDPCKACSARQCDDDACRQSGCEVGRCLTK